MTPGLFVFKNQQVDRIASFIHYNLTYIKYLQRYNHNPSVHYLIGYDLDLFLPLINYMQTLRMNVDLTSLTETLLWVQSSWGDTAGGGAPCWAHCSLLDELYICYINVHNNIEIRMNILIDLWF